MGLEKFRAISGAKRRPASNQLHSAQADVAVPADNDMIMDGDAQRFGDLDDVERHLDVGGRRRRIA